METVSLQELIKDTAVQMQDLVTGTTTTSTAGVSAFTDTEFGLAADKWFQGSQAVFEETAYTAGGNINGNLPHEISNYVQASGVFTSGLPFRSAGNVAAGLKYFLIRLQGRGKPYQQYIAAIRYALDQLNVQTDVTDATLTTVADDYEYTVPANFAGVYKVLLRKTGYTDLQLLPRDWKMRPGRQLWISNANVYVANGFTLVLYGVANSALPATLDGTVLCNRADVADLAAEYLQRNSKRPDDNQRGIVRQGERLRYRQMATHNNLRMVLP